MKKMIKKMMIENILGNKHHIVRDNKLCNGCGICVAGCPMDVLRIDDKINKAVIRYPEDCTLCQWCERDCPKHAIYVSPVKNSQVLTSWG